MIKPFYKNTTYLKHDLIIGSILIIGFLVGTSTHARDITAIGFFGYKGFILFNIFWTLLVILDPLAAFLLFIDKKAGLILGISIMVFDILINTIDLFLRYKNNEPFTLFYYFFQVPFFILILGYSLYSIKKKNR